MFKFVCLILILNGWTVAAILAYRNPDVSYFAIGAVSFIFSVIFSLIVFEK